MIRQSRTQNDMTKSQNKEQIIETDSQLNQILVFSDIHFKITMINIFREIDQNRQYQKIKYPLWNLLKNTILKLKNT